MALQHKEEVNTTKDTFTLPFSAPPGAVLVFLNGQLLSEPGDYVQVDPTTIQLTFDAVPGDIARFYIDDATISTGTGVVTTANVNNGLLSISYIALGRETGISDLKAKIFDPSNTMVGPPVSLTEFHSSGVYSAKVDVGSTPTGMYLAEISSATRPSNSTAKTFDVQPSGGFGAMIQEATRTIGQTFVYKHIATPGLSDVIITIYDVNDNKLEIDQPMVEMENTGVYKFAYTPSTTGIFTGVMSSSLAQSKSATEVNIVQPQSSGGGTVISNKVGVGTREPC